MGSRGREGWPWLVLLAAAYFLAARATHELVSVGSFSPFWPPSGIALAGAVLLGRRALVAVPLAALAHGLAVGNAPWVAVGEALSNTLEPAIGLWLFRRLQIDPNLERVRDMALFAGPVVFLTASAGAVVGPTVFWLGGAIGDADPLTVYAMWWMGDAIGTLFVAPVIFATAAGRFAVVRRRPLEAVALYAALVLVLLAIFAPVPGETVDARPLSYLVAPFLLWAALRFGIWGASSAMLLVGLACAIGTVQGYGPFADYPDLLSRIWTAQLYLAMKALIAYAAAAADAERRAAIRLREDFLSAASHELKTPLTPLKAGLQLARQRLAAGQTIPATSFERLERQVNRLSRLIENLLDVSRLTAGRTLSFEQVDLAEAAREAAAGLCGTAAQAGCVVSVHADEPVVGRWDRVRVEQVLMNLLANAFKYAPGAPVEVTVERAGETARLSVRDYGGGIAAADRERIFRRFERGTLSVGGLGLGLFLSREIVEAQGGRLTLTSEPGSGATFVVELPLSPPERVLHGELPPRPGLFHRFSHREPGPPGAARI